MPRALDELLTGGGDPARAQRVMTTMLQMGKPEIQPLREAYDTA